MPRIIILDSGIEPQQDFTYLQRILKAEISKGTRRIISIALAVLALDQLAKLLVLRHLSYYQEKVIIPGFFKLVHWGNTGAAWSLFYGYNNLLAVVSVVALVVLFLGRRHFEAHRVSGQIALGLMFGGILGNLFDRILVGRRHVIDFIYFYVTRRGGGEIGFPAFNLADMSICTGVTLLFLLSIQNDPSARQEAPPHGVSSSNKG